MKIELNLPPGSRQETFRKHLNSEIRKKLKGFSGSARTQPDGLFESTIQGLFTFEQGEINLIWRLIRLPDGSLPYIEVEVEEAPAEFDWEHAIQAFVISILTSSLAERQQKFFRRLLFIYIGPQLDGEYWFGRVRFAPAWPEDNQPHLINAERVVSIDMEVDAIDDMDAAVVSAELGEKFAARISLLLGVGLYKRTNELVWVIPKVGENFPEKSERFHFGFLGYMKDITELPPKGSICPPGKYSGSISKKYITAGELLSLPKEARKILRAIDNAEQDIVKAFDSGARLTQLASIIGRQFPTVGLAYRIAAVEAISKSEKECRGFSDFIRKYVISTDNLDGLLDYMYGTVRSGHFHAGEFPLGEFEAKRYFDPFLDRDDVWSSSIQRTCHDILREAIVNWISYLLPPDTD